jgi:hypothetical protein
MKYIESESLDNIIEYAFIIYILITLIELFSKIVWVKIF